MASRTYLSSSTNSNEPFSILAFSQDFSHAVAGANNTAHESTVVNIRNSRGAVCAEEVRHGHPIVRRFIHENVVITGWEIVSKRVRKPTPQVAVRQQIFQDDAGIGHDWDPQSFRNGQVLRDLAACCQKATRHGWTLHRAGPACRCNPDRAVFPRTDTWHAAGQKLQPGGPQLL